MICVEYLEYLLTEFDEMGFVPSTLVPNDEDLVPNAEEYAKMWKNNLVLCINELLKNN